MLGSVTTEMSGIIDIISECVSLEGKFRDLLEKVSGGAAFGKQRFYPECRGVHMWGGPCTLNGQDTRSCEREVSRLSLDKRGRMTTGPETVIRQWTRMIVEIGDSLGQLAAA